MAATSTRYGPAMSERVCRRGACADTPPFSWDLKYGTQSIVTDPPQILRGQTDLICSSNTPAPSRSEEPPGIKMALARAGFGMMEISRRLAPCLLGGQRLMPTREMSGSALVDLKVSDVVGTGTTKNKKLWIKDDDLVIDAVKKMAEANVGALLVMNFDKLDKNKDGEISQEELDQGGAAVCGIVTERDYLKRVVVEGRNSATTRVKDIMTTQSKMIMVRTDTPILAAMDLMIKNHIRHIPIVEGDNMQGVLSIRDAVEVVVKEQADEVDRLQSFISGGYSG
mmetsp:Transcript_45985/g.146859  ORF Transcript_45985/g.146859 Transcript_45985/m.146859 type:complete len:282 (-) Transcript_45985:726-1571(-)